MVQSNIATDQQHNISGSYGSAEENKSVLECYAVLLGKQLLTF